MAELATEYSRNQILQQSGVLALTKANSLPETVLQLLKR
jgi:flagellin-like hook-associated protein FlgL